MEADPYKYFRVEARELLEGLGQGVLELEKGRADSDLVGRLLRLAHTLKGASRVVKQPAIAELAHTVEEVLGPHREGRELVPEACINELFRLLDSIAGKLAVLDPVAPGRANEGFLRTGQEEPFETVRVDIDELDRLLEEVSEAGVQLASLRREVERFERSELLSATLANLLNPPRSGNRNGTVGGPTAARALSLADDLRDSLDRLRRVLGNGLDRAERDFAQVRERANHLRLLPAGAVFPVLQRAVRDAAQSLHRHIDFETSGGENRLDAQVLGVLRGALVHVVRNAVAHGIEDDAVRINANKSIPGRIQFHVERRGNRMVFACRDDGRGIDAEAVRRAAIQRGLISSAEAESLSIDEALRLILRGGVTTSGSVTEVSGRGVGLDVVRETAARLRGNVELSTELGRGTIIEICVPVSLSAMTVLLVEIDEMVASIPLDAVQRTLRVPAGEIARSAEGRSVVCDGKAIPFLPLPQALGSQLAPNRNHRSWSVLVIQSGSAVAAVGAARLLGTATVVVHPLPALLDPIPTVAGVSLDAEGNPQLVLEPRGLVDAARLVKASDTEAAAAGRQPVLIVDDSLTTRMLERSILESAGYEVELATSGQEALDKARQRRYGLFVVDIEMPGIDGFELLAQAQADPVLRETPAILVTSRTAAEDRKRGEALGAKAYIVKSEFDQRYLLDTIRSLMG
jgi:two-component system chemotaxis sensor kinase CheA